MTNTAYQHVRVKDTTACGLSRSWMARCFVADVEAFKQATHLYPERPICARCALYVAKHRKGSKR